MIPKKSSKLYKEIAEELQIDETLVEDFIEFYYKNIREQMTLLKHPRINVDGLGYFVVKPVMVQQTIPKIEKALESHDTSTFNAYFNKKGKEVNTDVHIFVHACKHSNLMPIRVDVAATPNNGTVEYSTYHTS